MCKPFPTHFLCYLCGRVMNKLTTWDWIPCPEFRQGDGHLAEPKDCSVADWEPAEPVEFSADKPHLFCMVRERKRKKMEREEIGEMEKEAGREDEKEKEGEGMVREEKAGMTETTKTTEISETTETTEKMGLSASIAMAPSESTAMERERTTEAVDNGLPLRRKWTRTRRPAPRRGPRRGASN